MVKLFGYELFSKSDVDSVDYYVGSASSKSSNSNLEKDENSKNPFSKYNVDPRMIERWYATDPVVHGSVNRVSDFVSSSGYEVKNDKNKKVTQFFEKISLPSFIRNLTGNIQLYDDSFIDLRDDYPKVVGTIGMSVIFNRKGEVTGYEQKLPNTSTTVRYDADRIVHVKMNMLGEGITGISPIVPLSTYLQSKSAVETYNAAFFDRNGTPRLHYIIKKKNKELRKKIKDRLKELKPHEDLITDEDVEVKPIANPITDAQFEGWTNYLNNIIIVGLGTPDVVAGFSEGSNKATSRTQLQTFKYRIKALQTCIANVINTKIIPRYFKGSEAYIVFKDIDREDSNLAAQNRAKIAQTISNYVKNGVLTIEEARAYAIDDLENLTSDNVE